MSKEGIIKELDKDPLGKIINDFFVRSEFLNSLDKQVFKEKLLVISKWIENYKAQQD
jgi:hypothetical protein